MYRVLVHGMTSTKGGIESFIMNYYRRLNDKYVHFDFLCNGKNPYESEILDNNSKIFYLPTKTKHFVKYKKELKKFFERHADEYDCLWDNESTLANIDYLKLAKRYGIKRRIIHSHNSKNPYIGLKKIIAQPLHIYNSHRINMYATDFWGCSQTALNWFYPSKIESKAKVIPNAIDTQKFKYNLNDRENLRQRYQLSDKVVIGNVGRFIDQKNQLFLIDLFYILQKDDPKLRLVLIGEGPYKDRILNKIQELSLEKKVILPGLQSNMPAWYSAFDIFVLPSLFEGLSVAGLEAQATGIITLISEEANPNELKINQNLFSLSLNQNVNEWAKKVKYLLSRSKRLPHSIVTTNFKKKNYDLDVEAKKLNDLFLLQLDELK
ncbi:glycosyltransferase [Lactobacillus crispatus]|uniref:glycosyltransferase n=1 Tax=Lactobacillus crispatus TaxID=47770 RepID=UPI003F29C269